MGFTEPCEILVNLLSIPPKLQLMQKYKYSEGEFTDEQQTRLHYLLIFGLKVFVNPRLMGLPQPLRSSWEWLLSKTLQTTIEFPKIHQCKGHLGSVNG